MSVRRAGSRRSAPASASTRSRSSRSRRGPVRQSTTLWRLCASTRPILDQPDARGRAPRRQWHSAARAEGLGDRLRTIAGDAERLDPGGAYDLVYGVHLLHHVADRVAMLASMRRAARRGGVVVCVEPNPLNPAWYAYITLDRLRSWRVERGLLTIVPWALVRDYRRAGLSGVTRVMYGAVPLPAVNRWPGLLALEARLNRTPGLRLFCAVQIVRGVRDA